MVHIQYIYKISSIHYISTPPPPLNPEQKLVILRGNERETETETETEKPEREREIEIVRDQ